MTGKVLFEYYRYTLCYNAFESNIFMGVSKPKF